MGKCSQMGLGTRVFRVARCILAAKQRLVINQMQGETSCGRKRFQLSVKQMEKQQILTPMEGAELAQLQQVADALQTLAQNNDVLKSQEVEGSTPVTRRIW